MPNANIADSLAERAAVFDVVARFCERVDEYDYVGAAAAFTEDCFIDYGPGRGGPLHGRDAFAERLRTGQGQFRLTHHHLGQSRINVDASRTTADATTYVTAWHEDWAGARSTVRLRYVDTFVLTGQGWLMSSRRVHAAGVDGFLEDVDWNWVPRAKPERATQVANVGGTEEDHHG